MGKKGARSSTPGRASTDTPADRTDHADGYNTMTSIGEEENNVVPGIDSDPDDATPWGANLTFPDMVDLARTIKKEQTEAGNGLREKDGWREITILLRDAPMTAACPSTEEDAEEQGENKYLILARPPLRVAGAMHPRSTYKGERQPEGQSKKHTAFGAYTGGRVPAVPVFVDSKGEAEGEELKKEERRTGLTGGRGGEGEPGEGGEGEGGQQVDANQVEICVNPQGMTEKDVMDFNIPTGVPLVYELDANLRVMQKYYLLDDAAVKAKIEGVANQGKAK
eukprot:s5312_g3.t1